MSQLGRFFKKYFSFNRRERNGLIALLSIIFLLTVSLIWIRSSQKNISIKISPLETVSATRKKPLNNTVDTATKIIGANKKENALFAFDPNTLTASQAKQLGFSEKVFNVLNNFRNKGGKFKSAQDLKKVYGVTDNLFNKLEPYILIAVESNTKFASSSPALQAPPPMKKVVEINSADSLQLISLNGIGPALSRRIIIYRNLLGGFANKEQLREIYGMRDSLYNLFSEKVTVDPSQIKKINVNTATVDEMRKHAYIKFIIAQSIVNYRQKHGLYKTADDLLKVGSLSDDLIKKLTPYLEF